MKGFNSRYLHFWESSSEKKKPFPKLGKCKLKNKSLPQVGKARIEKK